MPGSSQIQQRPEKCSSLRAHLVRDINDLPAADWDSLLDPEELQQTHAFVRLCQAARIEDAEHWHLLLYQGERPCCLASLCRLHVNLGLLTTGRSRWLIQTFRRAWPGFLRIPVLFCGLPVSFGQPCLKIAPWADTDAVLQLLVNTLEGLAEETNTQLLCWKEFDEPAMKRLESLESHGYFRASSLPSCSLSLRWRSFADYQGDLTASYRRQLRATLRAGQSAGLRVRILEDFSGREDEIFALYGQVIERAEFRLETLNLDFIRKLNADLCERSRLISLERDGKALAVAILLQAGELTTFLLAGLDYSAPRQWQVYPNLVAEVLADAIRSGATRLEMGQTSYALKSRLGATATPRFLYLKHRRPLGGRLLRGLAGALFPEQESPHRRVFRVGPVSRAP